jgi:MFS transporter, SHS family, sialic acid transporter
MHRFGFTMPDAVIGFTIAAAIAGMIVIRFVRETKGLSLDDIDRERNG